VDLLDQGTGEARRASSFLRADGYFFDLASTSVLKRAIRTLWIVLDEMDLCGFPCTAPGGLTKGIMAPCKGLKEIAQKFGQEQVQKSRRSYDIRSLGLAKMDARRPRSDLGYAHLKEEEFPGTESLKDTLNWALPYWQKRIVPRLRDGNHVMISAHENSLRALVKYLNDISGDEILGLNIPAGYSSVSK
jgi:2,3-bisphosphoglycerate-dependent phosphoglycerate mutase